MIIKYITENGGSSEKIGISRFYEMIESEKERAKKLNKICVEKISGLIKGLEKGQWRKEI